MRQIDKERIQELFESSVDELDRTAAYEAIALAEREEADPASRQLLHDAALALLRGQSDKAHLDKARALLASIPTEA